MPQPPIPFPPVSDRADDDAQPTAGTATETLATVVIKFQEAVSLVDVFPVEQSAHSGVKASFRLSVDYLVSSQFARVFYGQLDDYKPVGIGEFWQYVSATGGTLVPLLNHTEPSLLLKLLERAYNQPNRMKSGYKVTRMDSVPLQSANPFTYFKVVCPLDRAVELEKALQAFTPDGKTKAPLLELAYVRGEFVGAGSRPSTATNPTDFRSLLNVPNTPFPADSSSRLHIVDQGWSPHRAYNHRLTLDQRSIRFPATDSVPEALIPHGCRVLGVLIGDDSIVKGVVPGVAVNLYSAYDDAGLTRIDDALAHAFDAATANDVILLELALVQLHKLDVLFPSGAGTTYYPLDTDQACYDLIWLATNELGLTIVEPAGNSSLDLDALDRYFATQQRRINPTDTVDYEANYSPTGRLAEGQIIHRARYVSNQLPSDPSQLVSPDSGAIVVGAATVKASKWVNSSSFGTRIDCVAPGEGLKTTDTNNGYLSSFGMTSGASALLAGFIVYLKAKQSGLTALSVRRLLRGAAQGNTTQSPVSLHGAVKFPNLGALLEQFAGGV
ncbi:hypothetical protein FAES_3453 [Fibrella aestuarina BUZ 2]|uniref:Peptidase S8/S53 domain-containing protein n=1 Tax=Fibrella aestuarina BUZ 2 TaxID=1166018 RepID=I0KBF7_9BACT|nr:S8 family serine peptidase [Fibrella aestuarina]CCH01460.1 hypothetical protein FAES_3453 [Fibrella aestuarina BUZ 2]